MLGRKLKKRSSGGGALSSKISNSIVLPSEGKKEIILKITPKLESDYESVASHSKQELTELVKMKVYFNLNDFHEFIGWLDAPNWIIRVRKGRSDGYCA